MAPIFIPTAQPVFAPSQRPVPKPSQSPSHDPTPRPSPKPSSRPTARPSSSPTVVPRKNCTWPETAVRVDMYAGTSLAAWRATQYTGWGTLEYNVYACPDNTGVGCDETKNLTEVIATTCTLLGESSYFA
jgi:hypothetical protein